jgi:hypothetical protein
MTAWITTASITKACLWFLGLSVAASANAQQPGSGAPVTPHVFREDIEWLDIWMPDSKLTNQPRVLLIGDSITRAYNPEVEKALKGKAVVFRFATSKCAGDPVLTEEISLVLRQYQFDVIHFNNGIHGPEYSDETYGDGLRDMITMLRKYDPKAKLVWATTTSIRVSGQVEQLDSSNARAIRRNTVAAAIMKPAGIPTDDLYNLVLDHPEYYKPDGIHFNEKGVEVEAKAVARRIAELLPEPERPASPK